MTQEPLNLVKGMRKVMKSLYDDKSTCSLIQKFHPVKEGRKPLCYAKDHQVDESKGT
jgi:hypothetical protein